MAEETMDPKNEGKIRKMKSSDFKAAKAARVAKSSKAPAPKAQAPARTPARTPAKAKKPSKVEFVRSLPRDMKAKDVVEKAKAAGLKITPAYVYVIRSSARGEAPKAAGRKQGYPVSVNEREFRKMLMEIGVPRARVIVNEVEARLNELINGR